MTVELDFGDAWTPPSAGATDLDFATVVETAPVAAAATIRILLSPPTGRIRATYNNLVSRKLEGGARMAWQPSALQTDAIRDGWSDTSRHRYSGTSDWERSLPIDEAMSFVSAENRSTREASRIRWDKTQPNIESTADRFDPLLPQHEQLRSRWNEGQHASRLASSPFVWLVPQPRQQTLPWQQGQPRKQRWQAGFARGVWKSERWQLPWDGGRQPRFGESRLPGLTWRPSLPLVFGAHPCQSSEEPGAFSVPVLKVYFVSNSVDVIRLPGREPIPVKSIQISIDADSWCWGFSASLPYSALELIEPTSTGPVEIQIAINGVTWVMLVEGFDVRREFGQSSLGIRGRSLAAYLSDPYALKRSFVPEAPFTARQLAEQELTRPDLVTGFALDWRLPDWLLPTGSWSYESLSPMSAMGRLVESVGGYLNAHTRLKTLVAKSRYPELPWNWDAMSPDRALPIDVVKTLNLRWQEKPSFNAVYVSGERQGVTGRVIRSGTVGDVAAPMVVDGLITHLDAARERGRSILADVGKQAMVTLELPMLASLGLLDPGLLIAVGADGPNRDKSWRGLVRATSISAEWSESLTVRQTVDVERHYL